MNNRALKFLIFFLLIFSFTGSAQTGIPDTEKNSKEKEFIKSHKIKFRTEWGYNYKFGVMDDNKRPVRRIFYDKNGNELEIAIFDTLGIIFSRIINKYNVDDYLIERQFHRLERMAARITNIYDEKGMHVESGYYEYDGKVNHIAKIKYDEKGNAAELLYFLPNNDLDIKFLYRYDSLNRKIEGVEYSADGNAAFKRKYKYDSNNNLIEQVCFDRTGERIEKLLYEYNSAGKITVISWFDVDNTRTIYTINKYDNRNILIESVSYNGMDEPEYLVKYIYEFYE
jgi:hypothetical protein